MIFVLKLEKNEMVNEKDFHITKCDQTIWKLAQKQVEKIPRGDPSNFDIYSNRAVNSKGTKSMVIKTTSHNKSPYTVI